MKNECLLNLLGFGSCNRFNWNIWNIVILIIYLLFKMIRSQTKKTITYIKRTQVSNIESRIYWKFSGNINFICIVINFFTDLIKVIPLGCNFVFLWDENRFLRKCIQTQSPGWKMISFRPLLILEASLKFCSQFSPSLLCAMFWSLTEILEGIGSKPRVVSVLNL